MMAPSTKTLAYIASMLSAVALCVAATAYAQTGRSSETAVKATYLYKFVPFVTWPPSEPGSPIHICVIGHDPFGAELDRAIAGQSYASRSFRVVRLAHLDRQSQCDIAHIDGSPDAVAANLAAIKGRPVLTVTNDKRPAGVIDFTVHQGRVRFRVDLTAARSNGLQVSSKLLELALAVRK